MLDVAGVEVAGQTGLMIEYGDIDVVRYGRAGRRRIRARYPRFRYADWAVRIVALYLLVVGVVALVASVSVSVWLYGLPVVAMVFAGATRQRAFRDAVPIEAADLSWCRWCGHDVSGVPDDATRCPECGEGLPPVHATL